MGRRRGAYKPERFEIVVWPDGTWRIYDAVRYARFRWVMEEGAAKDAVAARAAALKAIEQRERRLFAAHVNAHGRTSVVVER